MTLLFVCIRTHLKRRVLNPSKQNTLANNYRAVVGYIAYLLVDLSETEVKQTINYLTR